MQVVTTALHGLRDAARRYEFVACLQKQRLSVVRIATCKIHNFVCVPQESSSPYVTAGKPTKRSHATHIDKYSIKACIQFYWRTLSSPLLKSICTSKNTVGRQSLMVSTVELKNGLTTILWRGGAHFFSSSTSSCRADTQLLLSTHRSRTWKQTFIQKTMEALAMFEPEKAPEEGK